MRKLSTLLFVLVACIGCDQSTKYTAKHYLEGKGTYSYINDIFRLGYAENNGAFLGLGSTLPDNIRILIFTGFVALILLAFLCYVITSTHITKIGVVGGALIIGGGLSNLVDRLVNNGAVIDFLNLGIGSLRTGIFNVADMAIMLGALFMLWFKNETV